MIRRRGEAAGLEVDQEFAPALRALAHPDLETDEFLLSFGCSPEDHQHALGLDLHRFCSGQVLMLGGPLFEGHG